MVYALRDPIGANLDRIQIVKGWLDAERQDPRERSMTLRGRVTASRVRRASCRLSATPWMSKNANWTNTIGSSELATVWTDPDFNPKHKAFYYARVLEIPTPRWSTYDAFRYGIDPPEGAPGSTQERAYTSPIWYTPKS